MFIYLVVVAIVLGVIDMFWNHSAAARLIRKLPGPRSVFLLGNTLEVIFLNQAQLFRIGRKYAKMFKDIYGFNMCGIKFINILNPEDIEVVVSSMKHTEKSDVYRFLSPWLREGLLLSKGTKWQQRRKILTPAFHFNILKQFHTQLGESSARLVTFLKSTRGKAVDIGPVVSEYTLNAICETAMGTRLDEVSSDADNYKNAIQRLGEIIVFRFSKMYCYFDYIFNLLPHAKKQKLYLEVLKKFSGKVIKKRKEFLNINGVNNILEHDHDTFMGKKKKNTFFLDLLIAAEKDGLIDRAGIQEEVDTFMFEGHDTTAAGLTFCLFLLANHRDTQDKISEELENIFRNSTRVATIEDLSMMRYLECSIKEALRLYPPVPFISRQLSETAKLSNHTMPQGITCNIHIYDLHRREDLFKDAEVFNPDRFLPENSFGRHPYSYIPFSAGPRNCIGQKYAIMELKSFVAAILRNFELVPVSKDIEVRSDLVLRSINPIYIKFVERSNK